MIPSPFRLFHVLRCVAWLLFFMTSAGSPGVAAAPEGRPQLSLAGDWKMAFCEEEAAMPAWSSFKIPATASLPKDAPGLLLEREITIPETWKGSRIVVHIGHPVFTAAIYVSGTHAGDILGFGGEVDISQWVRYGAPSTLRLFFPREGGSALAGDSWGAKVLPTLSAAERERAGILGMADTIYIEQQPRDILVSDVWYRTFTRGSTRIEPQISLNTARPLYGLRAFVNLYSPGSSEPAVSAECPLETVPVGESIHTVKIPAGDLKLWSLREPNLYVGQVILTDAAGNELDRSAPVTFGIREFWIEGKDYYLNNHRVNFTLDAYLFPSYKQALDAGVTLTFQKHADNGVNLVHDNEGEARQCDQLGMGYISYGVGVGFKSPSLSQPDNLAAYRVWLQAHMRRLRNHPSILFWVLSTNMAGGDTFNPATIGRSSFLRKNDERSALPYIEQRRADDTRPAFHHQSAGTGDLDAGNVYFNHLPQQSAEDWVSAWKESGDRPYMFIEYMGTPLVVDYVKSNTQLPLVSYATEYAARLSGDRAYREETPAYRDYSTYAVPRLNSIWNYDPLGSCPLLMEQLCKGIPETYRACRYYGVPSDLWVFPLERKKQMDEARAAANQRLMQVATDVLAPVMCWIGGPESEWTSKAHQFLPGEPIRKSVLCINDEALENRFTVRWSAYVRDTGAIVASGTGTAVASPWGRAAVPIEFTAPGNSSERPLPMEIRASVSGPKGLPDIACTPLLCTVWPEPQKPAHEPISFTVYDPEGETTAWLQKTGVKTEPFEAGISKPSILILGRRALCHTSKLPFTAEDIHAGMRVLICEQNCGDLEKFGFRTEDHSARVVFARSKNHPLLAGIDDEALHDWNGNATMLPWGPEGDTTHIPNSRRSYHWSNRGTVTSNMVETPHFGPFKPIIDCEFDLAYSPLFSWRHGAGEILFSQLDLTARTASDPAVTRLQRNLVDYLKAPLASRAQNRIALCVSDETRRQIAALGFACGAWDANANPDRNVLVLSRNDWGLWPSLREQVLAFAEKGGDVLLFPAGGDLLTDPLFRGLTVKPVRVDKVDVSEAKDSLLEGVGPQNVHWRESLEFLKIEATAGSGFEDLLSGFVGKIPCGKGRFLFLQIDPGVLGDYATAMQDDERLRKPGEKPLPSAWYAKDRKRSLWQSNRLSALIMANLGVESSTPLVKAIFQPTVTLPFYPVDKWMLLGPIPAPSDLNASPVAADFSPLLKERSLEKPVALPNGAPVPWYAPNDFNNGLGIAGMVDFSKAYGFKPRQTVLALTYLWSSRDRMATFQFGAEQWLKLQVNGREIFQTRDKFAKEFGFSVKMPLKKGWNEVICAVGAGSAHHLFWFRVSNPGDMIEAQTIVPPKDAPTIFLRFASGGKFGKMTDAEIEAAENAEPGFSLYTEPLSVIDDPYLYMRW